jgi:hypothetical protein
MSEFEEDFSRILYIKRLLTKYYSSGSIREKLMLNHIIVIYNVFSVEAATRILFFKLDEKDYTVLKPFLIFLNFLPPVVMGINGRNINTSEISLDENIVKVLRNLR